MVGALCFSVTAYWKRALPPASENFCTIRNPGVKLRRGSGGGRCGGADPINLDARASVRRAELHRKRRVRSSHSSGREVRAAGDEAYVERSETFRSSSDTIHREKKQTGPLRDSDGKPKDIKAIFLFCSGSGGGDYITPSSFFLSSPAGALWNMLLPKKKRKEARYARDRVKRRDEEGTKGGYCFVVECGCGFRWWVCGGEEDGSNAMRCEGRCERESWFSCVHERRKWRRGSVASATATHSSPTPHLALPINPLLPKPNLNGPGSPSPLAREHVRPVSGAAGGRGVELASAWRWAAQRGSLRWVRVGIACAANVAATGVAATRGVRQMCVQREGVGAEGAETGDGRVRALDAGVRDEDGVAPRERRGLGRELAEGTKKAGVGRRDGGRGGGGEVRVEGGDGVAAGSTCGRTGGAGEARSTVCMRVDADAERSEYIESESHESAETGAGDGGGCCCSNSTFWYKGFAGCFGGDSGIASRRPGGGERCTVRSPGLDRELLIMGAGRDSLRAARLRLSINIALFHASPMQGQAPNAPLNRSCASLVVGFMKRARDPMTVCESGGQTTAESRRAGNIEVDSGGRRAAVLQLGDLGE
ncbi:hypothetical protein B0H14DRAFT_2588065 [Mycena olivaceomarginata]|nr:hypothetical protein B0H14DRAFT_2588065 [Mycena olivaceomarginata]